MVRLTAELQRAARQREKREMSSAQAMFANSFRETEVLVAAAGAGKTTCLLERFERCLEECALGTEVVIISFSNSAADTFQKRFEHSWGEQTFRVARTFHSWVKSDVLTFPSICGYPLAG